jgi:hypothetical protein
MATVLRNYCQNTLKVFSARYETSAALTHGSSVGSIREQAIRDFLESHLPALVSVTSGQIFDTHDTLSKQQDVILVMKGVPRLPFASGIDLVYAEGVVATIEVKSALSAPKLKDIGESIRSVRALARPIWSTTSFGVNHRWPETKILSSVVTYGGSALSTMQAMLASMDEDTRPDILLDLSKGLLVRNNGSLLTESTDGEYVAINDAADGFMKFLTFLVEITATLGSRGINWRAYF